VVEYLRVFGPAGFFLHAFTSGTVVQVFQFAGSAPIEAWSGTGPGN